MSTNRARICTSGKIWDLHIHSKFCYSTTDKRLKALTTTEYVAELLKVLDEYDNLEMVSFTDHNHICTELYQAFYDADSRIVLLPGIEIDVQLEDGEAGKHLIVYFDAIADMPKIEMLSEKLNAFLEEHSVGSGKGKSPINISTLLDELVTYGIHFALSPHAMKQGKRGIDYNWHSLSSEEQDTEAKKYLDQFFCFWESSGKSEIAHAVEFLKKMDRDELISVISFSDSKDFGKLRTYLDNPSQYFNALPNFNGLKMVGSEHSRITEERFVLDERELGSYIGRVDFFGQSIELSPRLNAIIGGRGKGKSVFLDCMANYLDPNKGWLTDRRRQFISSLPITVCGMGGTVLPEGAFRFDYYNQSYIASLFDKDGEEFNDAVEDYFKDAFSQVPTIDANAIELANRTAFIGYLEEEQAAVPGNIVGFIEKYVIDNKDKLSIRIFKNMMRQENSELRDFDYDAAIDALDEAVRGALPAFIGSDEAIENAITLLKAALLEAAYKKRIAFIEGDSFYNSFIECFIEKKKELSDAQKERDAAIRIFEAAFTCETAAIKKRVALVNAFIRAAATIKRHYIESKTAHGETPDVFQFKHELDIEHPFEYIARIINNHLYVLPGKHQCDTTNLWDYVLAFCFKEDGYKQGSSWKKLYDDLKAYKLVYSPLSSICYRQDDGEYVNIATLSPGTQTNILIEYIVYKEGDVPLLIDQPEDNVDNQTIYDKIRGWFMELKVRRQVIVVTHDANIVINADAENVILANQIKPGVFAYDFGALEYSDVIDRASLILDGGKDAVKRRLVKYGD